MTRPSRQTVARLFASMAAGLLVAASLPPWGFWPLAIVGLALWEWSMAGRRGRFRSLLTAVFVVSWLAPGMSWMWQFTVPGFVLVLVLFAGYHALAVLALPGPPNDRWRWLALPAAFTAAEALRFCFPFGGVPLASLPLGQVSGPLVGVSRIGGPVLLTFVTAFIGTNIRRAVQPLVVRSCSTARRLGNIGVVGAVATVPVLVLIGSMVPRGTETGQSVTITIVQGGGEQGTRAIRTIPRLALNRALTVTKSITTKTDLVIWPENVVNVPNLSSSRALQEVAAEAARLNAPLVVGITERDSNPRRFRNAQVVVLGDGSVMSRYEKKRRVPFGEYMPWRSFLHSLGVPTELVPRDAVAGTEPAVLYTPVGTLGVAISWEVFFGGRVREAVRNGAEVIINPTNGASYRGTILQSQQIAASRLRAIESGRWVIQVAPTGFSAFVSPGGKVLDRIGQTEQAWRQRTVPMRSGLTWYEHTGDIPWVLVVLVLWSVPTFGRLAARRNRSNPSGDTADEPATPPPAP